MDRRRSSLAALVVLFVGVGCGPTGSDTRVLSAQEALTATDFAGLIERISEDGGYFDTDNLISNESGYLNVIGALDRSGLSGGAYVGVGPDQNYSYIAELRPDVAFITDIRRDNLLHHLLLKALIERAPTRVEFLAGLHGVSPPPDAGEWEEASVDRIVSWVDSAWAARRRAGGGDVEASLALLEAEVSDRVRQFGVELDDADLETIARFHRTFVEAGLGLRFTSFGRAPRPYYPTYRQLVLETDADGDAASYLADDQRYRVVRDLHLANRIVPVVGDLSGRHAVRELGEVLGEMGVELSAFYTSNVEFYLWQSRSFERWLDNLRSVPSREDAVVIRSYFPNSGRSHPSALPGYYATQSLQSVATLRAAGFRSYWEAITADVIPLR